MTPTPVATEPPPGERRMTRTYLGVIVVEAITLAALWWFQSTFR